MRKDRRINEDALCVVVPEVARSIIHKGKFAISEGVCQCEFLRQCGDKKDNFLLFIITGDET